MMVAFVIWIACAALFLLFGIYSWNAKQPVRFWTVQESIQVNDVKAYNRAVAKLWIVSAGFFTLLGLPLLLEHKSTVAIIPILGSMYWAIAVMVAYTKIEKKYRV